MRQCNECGADVTCEAPGVNVCRRCEGSEPWDDVQQWARSERRVGWWLGTLFGVGLVLAVEAGMAGAVEGAGIVGGFCGALLLMRRA
jgi:hypothetical protein